MKEINFPCLQQIYLPYNNIESVEVFCWMKMPLLEEFNVGKNNLVSIKNVRKAYWPNFLNFNISN